MRAQGDVDRSYIGKDHWACYMRQLKKLGMFDLNLIND